MQPSKNENFCFCTLALGNNYRNLALELVQDLQKFAPNTEIVILTDYPAYFKTYSNVLAFPHQPRSVYLFYDKIYVIEKALSLHKACIFIDSDVRILAPVPEDMALPPGITAHSCYSIHKLYDSVFKKQNSNTKSKNWELICQVTDKLDVNLNDVKFVWEYLFYITRDDQTADFIKLWKQLGQLYELQGRSYGSEGESMGIAAAKFGIPVNYDHEKKINFFKYRVELYKISQGKADPSETSIYMERFRALKHPQYPLPQKILIKGWGKITYSLGVTYRLMRLRLACLGNFKFFYR